jgi:short-subunit dehydrogenase
MEFYSREQEAFLSSQQVAIVTGASSGIGYAIAAKLATEGYRVFGTSRKSEHVVPYGVQLVQLDVTDDQSVTNCISTIYKSIDHIDLLVNNAGVALVGAFEESSLSQIKALFEVNVFGAIRLAHSLLPNMRERRQGRIVNISSVVGFLPAPFSGVYAMSKHALESFSESLDHEVRHLGVRSILIEPYFTISNINANAFVADQPMFQFEDMRRQMLALFEKSLEDGNSPETVAKVVSLAATHPNPKVRYTVGRDAALLRALRRFMPSRAFEMSFRRQFGLPKS